MKTKLRVLIALVVILLLAAMYRVVVQSIECAYAASVSGLLGQAKIALQRDDNQGWKKICLKLVKMGSPAIKPLIAHLDDKDSYTAAAAQATLDRMGWPATKALRDALKDPRASVRANAARALFNSKDPRLIVPLIAAFKDKSRRVEHAAAFALWRKGGRAVDPLLVVLADRNAEVRGDAAMALAGIKDKQATLPLIKALHDPDKNVRMLSAQALGYIHDSRAVKPLVIMLLNRKEWGEARYQAGEALGHIGDRRAIEPLIRVLSDRTECGDVRYDAASALGGFNTTAAKNALKAALSDKVSLVRKAASEELGIKPSSTCPPPSQTRP